MLFIGYAASQILEFSLGIVFLRKMYPEMRRKGKYFESLVWIFYVFLCGIIVRNAWDSFISNMSIILEGLIVAAFYCTFFKVEYETVIAWKIFYSISIALARMPYMIISGIVEHKTLYQVNREGRSWGDFWYCILIDVFLVILIRRQGQTMKLLESLVIRHKKLLILVDMLLWCLLSYNMWLGKQGFHTVDLILAIIFILSTMLSMQYLVLRVTYQELKSENDILDAVQNVFQKQNYALQELYNVNAQRMHDLKHYMVYLMNCFENKKIEEGTKFLAEYMELLNVTGHKVWTGFALLDFILDYKKRDMDEKEIALELDVELYEYPFEEAEFGVLLGNLLDNAIEGAAECKVGERRICLKLSTVNRMFFLKLWNTSIRSPQIKAGKFQTTKDNHCAHGLGVESVKRIVKKYDGTIDFQYDNEHFEVNILI